MELTWPTIDAPPRPPLGVMPNSMWVEYRIADLAGAIERQLRCNKPSWPVISEWTRELSRHVEDRTLEEGI